MSFYVEPSSENCRKKFLEPASDPSRYLGVSERVIQKEHRKRGYQRHVDHLKSATSQKNMTTSREWAEAHLNWTFEDTTVMNARLWEVE
ncbi:Bgt-51180 [Blumeria graminis f. sp. tritici]|uniref:Bgt-51180 n=1 Tax=Blumeria graminis f. sp. tritici TaxID=62690 RepID=A0A9X9MK00_BLUGR|nr:Bgt-51180 [Blumeria graminis f. sp. tritici]